MQAIRHENFLEILKQGYTLNHIYVLQAIKDNLPLIGIEAIPSGQALMQSMVRKGLLSELSKITQLGEQLVTLAYSEGISPTPERVGKAIRKEIADVFDRWWNTFPGTDTFEYKGRKFSGSRALRTKKEDCKILFSKIVREGFTTEEMIGSLEYEVMQKKEDSYKRGENKLRFMQNSLTYLRQRTWEPYIELIRQGSKVEIEKQVLNSTDI